MSCNFSLHFSGNKEEVLNKARTAVESQGGIFNGDINSGDFSISVFGNNIAGSYSFNTDTLEIVITDKPFFVPCNTIENYLTAKIS